MRVLLFLSLLLTLALPAATWAEPQAKQNCIYAPLPEYPLEARAHNLEGNGIFVLHLDRQQGTVKSVTIEKSTGSALLDNAAIGSLKRWRFIKNIDVVTVKVPFTFTATGVID